MCIYGAETEVGTPGLLRIEKFCILMEPWLGNEEGLVLLHTIDTPVAQLDITKIMT